MALPSPPGLHLNCVGHIGHIQSKFRWPLYLVVKSSNKLCSSNVGCLFLFYILCVCSLVDNKTKFVQLV